MAFIKYASIKNWNEVNETVENVTRWEYSKRNHDNKQLFHLHSFKQGSHASLKVLEFECLVIESPWFYPVTARVNTHVLYKRHFLKTLKKNRIGIQECYSQKVANVVARTIGRTTNLFTVEAIYEICRTYECRKFGRKYTTYLQLSYTDRKSENLTDNQQLRHLYTSYCYLPTQITL